MIEAIRKENTSAFGEAEVLELESRGTIPRYQVYSEVLGNVLQPILRGKTR